MRRLRRVALATVLAYHAGQGFAYLYYRLYHIRSLHV